MSSVLDWGTGTGSQGALDCKLRLEIGSLEGQEGTPTDYGQNLHSR